jgi:hypothetical protein
LAAVATPATVLGTFISFATLSYANLPLEGNWNLRIKPIFVDRHGKPCDERKLQIIAAYGYAYEGHCYRFERPKVLAFETEGDETNGRTADLGCNFDPPNPAAPPKAWYRMWRLKSAQPVIELGADVNDVQKLILDANLPAKRAPSTYRAEMQLAHRGGRLSST